MKTDVSFDLPTGTLTFKDVELPDANTPLPPTNAAIHLLDREIDYGKPTRQFVALCGVTWAARDSSGDHKYFMRGDAQWHKHINCPACRELMESGNDLY